MPISTDPADLEDRVLRAAKVLRQIAGAIESLVDAEAPTRVIANVAVLAARLADQTAAEITS